MPFLADSMDFDPGIWIIAANNTIAKKPAYHFNMTLYPNPVRDYVDVRIETEAAQKVEIGVYNATGRLMFSTTHELQIGTTTLQLNTQNLAAGTYAVKLKGDKKPIAEKFIKAGN